MGNFVGGFFAAVLCAAALGGWTGLQWYRAQRGAEVLERVTGRAVDPDDLIWVHHYVVLPMADVAPVAS